MLRFEAAEATHTVFFCQCVLPPLLIDLRNVGLSTARDLRYPLHSTHGRATIRWAIGAGIASRRSLNRISSPYYEHRAEQFSGDVATSGKR